MYGAKTNKKRDFESYGGAVPWEERKKLRNGLEQDHNRPAPMTSHQKTSRLSSQPQPSPKEFFSPHQFISSKIDSVNGKARESPPLPPIKDQAIMKAVFTHQGTLSASDNLNNALSYERLEFLGDAYIELIASTHLFKRFPNVTPGRLSFLRELLVKNETLCEYALQYHLYRRMAIPKELNEKAFLKMMGDLIEAYVAGVILSNPKDGYAQVEAWLIELWTPKLNTEEKSFVSEKLAKQELSKRLGGKGIQIRYVDDRPPEQLGNGLIRYSIGAYLTGWGWTNEQLGYGTGLNKVLAGNAAAASALANNPLIDDISAVKQAFDASVKAQRNEESRNIEKV